MEAVYIKFDNQGDEVRGIHELAHLTRVDGYRGDIWRVGAKYLRQLDELGLAYRYATEEEVEAALAAVRHPAPALL
jgi:hypothetical protein